MAESPRLAVDRRVPSAGSGYKELRRSWIGRHRGARGRSGTPPAALTLCRCHAWFFVVLVEELRCGVAVAHPVAFVSLVVPLAGPVDVLVGDPVVRPARETPVPDGGGQGDTSVEAEPPIDGGERGHNLIAAPACAQVDGGGVQLHRDRALSQGSIPSIRFGDRWGSSAPDTPTVVVEGASSGSV